MTKPITIRPAIEDDFDAMWLIFHQVVASGDTYVYAPDTNEEECHKILFENTHPFVATIDDNIVGLFVIRQNKTGLGSHVCNAGFMVSLDHRRQGIGKVMGQYALKEAKKIGFKAMQYNVVVSTNDKAIALWKSLGFTIIGTVPQAYQHSKHGLVDIYIMHRFL